MADVTQLLHAIEQGKPQAASELLPVVYDELRRLAARQMAEEKPGQTLDATALVHEAFLRLAGQSTEQRFANRRHFFAAAAEAMRRILVEIARRKARPKQGGTLQRVAMPDDVPDTDPPLDDVLTVDAALEEFRTLDPATAELVTLHFFGGLSLEDVAELLGLSARTAYRDWAYARAWLFRRLEASQHAHDVEA